MDLNEVFTLRDGIDVYYKKDEEVAFFVFLASRKRIHVKCIPVLIKCLSDFDGKKSLLQIFSIYQQSIQVIQFLAFCEYLLSKSILIKSDWRNDLLGSLTYKQRLSKQLDFLLDIVIIPSKAIDIQNKIKNTKVAIMGVGSVGSWIARELTMVGFQDFLLFDTDIEAQTDISRHEYFSSANIGKLKTLAAKEQILSIDNEAKVSCINDFFSINSKLDFLDDCQLIINCMDEPYIGYTSIKLSRYCISKNKILLIAGGFDAHLGSFGELIIPFVTPCADCYATYFTSALKNWQPIKRDLVANENEMGGLGTLSSFSASMAILEILKYFIDPTWISHGRGEFLFTNYHIDNFIVSKDINCKICSTPKSNA